MTALDDLGAWLQSQYSAQFDTGAASRQGEIDAALTALAAAKSTGAASAAQVTTLTAQLSTLQAKYDAYVAAHPATPPVTPPASVVEFKDFALTNNSGMYLGKTSLVKTGTFRMTPSTSTKTAPTTGTNPYYLMWAGGTNSTTNFTGLEYAGFTLEGTEQGHLYNGFMLGWSVAAKIHDLKIVGVPGNSSGPPGETFPLNLWHTTDASITNVVLDGRRVSDQTPVSATLLGYNFTGGSTVVTNLVAQYAQYGFAAAFWQCPGNQVFNKCTFSHSRKAINIEQADGGAMTFNGCTFTQNSAPYVAQVSAKPGSPSCKVTFTDCIVDKYPLQVRTYPNHDPQLDSDIRCFEKGKEVTSDPTRFQIVHTG